MTFNNINKVASLIIIFTFITQGCTSVNTAKISQNTNDEYTQLLRSDNKILLTRIAIKDVKAANAGDLMRTNIVLHNRWHFTLDFSYQVRWYDENDFEIDPGSHPWNPVVIGGKDDLTVQSTAPRASATQFKIYIKD